MTITYTTNRNYPKPDFDTRTWHQQMWQSLDMIDADITAELQGVSGFVVEAWDNNRGYLINAKVMDVDRLQLYVCNVNHTSAASGSMTADRTAHPTYWTSFGVPLVPRGVWAQNTAYNVMDHVYDTVQGISAICALAHTSTASGNIRTDASKWLFIVDLQLILSNNVITSPTTGTLLTLRSTDPGSVGSPNLLIDRLSASPAVNDILGGVIFSGQNTVPVSVTYGMMRATIVDPAAYTGSLEFLTSVGGSLGGRFKIGSGFWASGSGGVIDQGAGAINGLALYENNVALTAKYGQLAVANTWSTVQIVDLGAALGVGLTLRSSEPGASGAPDLVLDRASASPAVNDSLGRIVFNGNNDALVDALYGQIKAVIVDPAAGTRSGYLAFTVASAGAAADRLRIGAGIYTLNAAGGDKGVDTINATALYENGTPLTARYAAGAGSGNILRRNGGLEVWQRGAGGAASMAQAASLAGYTADGWYLTTGANEASVVSQQAGLTNGSQWSAKILRNNGQTGTTIQYFSFPLDTDEIYPMLGQFVCLSFTAKAGANWSPASGNIVAALQVGTGTPVKYSTATYTNNTQPFQTAFALTTTTTRFQVTSSVIVPTTTRQAEVLFYWVPVGTAGADDSFTIDDVQLEIVPAASGYVASSFQRLNFEEQLALCQRHYQKTFLYATAPASSVGVDTGEAQGIAGKAGATAGNQIFLRWPVRMRVVPSITSYNPGAAADQMRDESANVDCTSIGITPTEAAIRVNATGNASTVVGARMGIHLIADSGI